MQHRNKLLLRLTQNMPARAIDLDDKHYIERYQVAQFGKVHIYLHRYLGCDGDRQIHDHPWRYALGIPLVGGYAEEVLTALDAGNGWRSKMVWRRPWCWNLINARTFHRIAYVEKGTWSLFITFERFKAWGFLSRTDFEVIYSPHYGAANEQWAIDAPTGAELRAGRGT